MEREISSFDGCWATPGTNAIVLGETGVLNNVLRFEDEFVRHKILDVIGDLALIGYPLIGHVVAHRGGHALHANFAQKILNDSFAWKLVESLDKSSDEGHSTITTKADVPVAAN